MRELLDSAGGEALVTVVEGISGEPFEAHTIAYPITERIEATHLSTATYGRGLQSSVWMDSIGNVGSIRYISEPMICHCVRVRGHLTLGNSAELDDEGHVNIERLCKVPLCHNIDTTFNENIRSIEQPIMSRIKENKTTSLTLFMKNG